MKFRCCIETPAGERHSVEVESAAPPHGAHAPLRLGVAHLLRWCDDHVTWEGHVETGIQRGTPFIKRDILGAGDWQVRCHPAERKCDLEEA